MSRPNRPNFQGVTKVLGPSGALAAFSLRLRQPESGVFGAVIERYEVTAISGNGAVVLVVNSTVVRRRRGRGGAVVHGAEHAGGA